MKTEDLIDRRVLLMHLSDYQLQESPDWGANGYGNRDRYEAITDCINMVENMPGVDAVPFGTEMWMDRFEIQTRTWRSTDGNTVKGTFTIARKDDDGRSD